MSTAPPSRPSPHASQKKPRASLVDDVSSDDDDNDTGSADADPEARRDGDDNDTGAPDGPSDDPAQPETWEEFWQDACERNARRAREAGGDPSKLASAKAPPKGRHGLPLHRGVPVAPNGEEAILCFGCDQVTTRRMECAQCLEIFKRRAEKVAFDTFERAFFCSHLCYQSSYAEHKSRHGASRSAPTEMDGREHEFEPAEGDGALWDAEALKRHTVENCPAAF
jgi:hypothetical protein